MLPVKKTTDYYNAIPGNEAFGIPVYLVEKKDGGERGRPFRERGMYPAGALEINGLMVRRRSEVLRYLALQNVRRRSSRRSTSLLHADTTAGCGCRPRGVR